MPHTYGATVEWSCVGDFAGNGYSRGHLWRFDGGVEVPASASPTVVPLPHAVEAAVDPEEAYIAAISSCHMLWFLDLARQAGHSVRSYRDDAHGTMGRIAPGKFAITTVTLRPATVFDSPVPDRTNLGNLHHRAHEACFIANSVKTEIRIEPQRM